MSQEILYQFADFSVNASKGVMLLQGQPVDLTGRPFKLLVVLIENRNRFVTKEELMRLVWNGDRVSDGNLHVNLNKVRKALGETAENPRFIFRTADGYKFVGDVEKRAVRVEPVPVADQLKLVAEVKTEASFPGLHDESTKRPGKHLAHILASCILYATLYASAVLLEIAYDFDRFGRAAFQVAWIVFCWILGSSVVGLLLGQKRNSRSGRSAFLLMVLFFFGSALIAFAGLTRFLPNEPITRSAIGAYPAQAAYLKDTVYFLVLALLFMIIPFHFVSMIRREVQEGRYRSVLNTLNSKRLAIPPKGAIYLRFGHLALVLLTLGLLSIAMTTHLLDNLLPGPHRNLFTLLVYLRGILYFGLGIECLAWYYSALADLKRDCVSPG